MLTLPFWAGKKLMILPWILPDHPPPSKKWMLPNRPNHVKMLKWLKKVWNLMNILVPSSKIFKGKSLCKSALQNKLFADVSDPSGYSFPSGPWNYVVPYTTCQTTEKTREILAMIRPEISSVIHMIPSHLLSWSVICKIKYIYVYWMSSTIPLFKLIETTHIFHRSVICEVKYIYVYRIWLVLGLSSNQSIQYIQDIFFSTRPCNMFGSLFQQTFLSN